MLYFILREYIMRKFENEQMILGEVDISLIQFDKRSRDDIPQLLLGLQHIYMIPEIRMKIFSILEKGISSKTNVQVGRLGMSYWKIFVLGCIRLNLNIDYDRLLELANEHRTLRLMLGHCEFNNHLYSLQTLKDNIRLLTPEILDQINQEIVNAGHSLLKKSEGLKARCDSFVVETDVHFPTDINLLFDCAKKVITISSKLCSINGLWLWKEWNRDIKELKNLYHKIRKMKHSNSKNEEKRKKQEDAIKEAHLVYVEKVRQHFIDCYITIELLDKERITIPGIEKQRIIISKIESIKTFLKYGEHQINLIIRRVINGEKIPHNEKVFSVFEPHTEWICKGKAGVPVELGLKVCVLEDQFGFILHHHVMEHQSDNEIAVLMVKEAKKRFQGLSSCSFDKGFHSPLNQIELLKYLDLVILPKKGKLNQKERQRESSEAFVEGRKAHSAVESCINALEVHGLDKCSDHGLEGFKRYIALSVVARNVQKLGSLILKNMKNSEPPVKQQLIA